MAIGLAITAKAEVTATPVTGVYPLNPQTAMEVDDENRALFQPAVVSETDTDVTVIIFDEYFSIEKQFTLPINEGTSFEEQYTEGVDIADIEVTKNFFVKNDKWCVTFRHELAEGGSELLIIDEDGNHVGTLPAELYSNNIFFSNLIAGIPYWVVYIDGIQGPYSEYFQLYTFTGNAGVEASKVASFPKAYPNPLPAGATFTVDFAQVADNATFFTVLDMNGRQVYRTKVKPGETSFELSGARFGHGQYVYTVVYGNGEAVSGKLLAE